MPGFAHGRVIACNPICAQIKSFVWFASSPKSVLCRSQLVNWEGRVETESRDGLLKAKSRRLEVACICGLNLVSLYNRVLS